jgi:hypothetical protein
MKHWWHSRPRWLQPACALAALAVMLDFALQGAHLLHGRQAISPRLAWVMALLLASLVGVADMLGAASGLAAWAWLQRRQ